MRNTFDGIGPIIDHNYMEKMEEKTLIDMLRRIVNKDIRAMLLEGYIQEYGPLSDANGEIVRQILMKGADDE